MWAIAESFAARKSLSVPGVSYSCWRCALERPGVGPSSRNGGIENACTLKEKRITHKINCQLQLGDHGHVQKQNLSVNVETLKEARDD